MSLATGNQLCTFNWTEFPIGRYVINNIEEMSIADNKLIMTNGYTIF